MCEGGVVNYIDIKLSLYQQMVCDVVAVVVVVVVAEKSRRKGNEWPES